MRKLFWSVLCVTALFASCAEADIEVRPVMGGEDFTATIAETRAELDGVAVLWNDADELTIFTKTAHNRHYKVKSLSNGNRSATFGYVGFTGNDSSAIENNYAVYPYDANATLAGEIITTKINAEQVYNAEKVDLSNALMAAKSTSSALQFVNSTALMRFDVANNMPDSYTLSSIKLVSAANKIAGEATINLSTDSKAVVTENGVNEVTLSGIDTPITAEKQAFYVVLPATSFAAKDLTVTFTYAEGVEKSFALPAFDLELGSIKTIAYTINEGEDFEGSTPDSGEDFEGETPGTEAKPANNEIWYTTTTNSIASISTNANEVSHEYKDGKGVIVYDADVTTLVVSDFAVETISIPSTITKWDQLRFYGFNLKKLIGDNVSDDGRCLIVNGELLMFASKGLTEYTFPNNITKIGNGSCSMAYSVSKFVIPEGVTAIGENAFEERYDVDDSPILTVELPSTLQTIGSYAFSNAKIETITIPSSVNYIGRDAFTDRNNYINLLSTTPCEIGGKICGDNSIINVPESNWKSYVYSDDWCEIAHLVRINGEVPNYDSIPCFQLWYTSTNGELVDFDISNELFGSTSIISNVYQNGQGVITCAGPIREICQGAFFYEAPLFKTITLPSSIRTIGSGAFVGHDNNLTDVYCNIATPPTGGEDMFYNNNDNIGNIVTIYVPVTSIDDYKNANYWKEYNIVGYDFETNTIVRDTPNTNEIFYTTTDGSVVTLRETARFGANVVSNEYKYGRGVITFDADVTTVGVSSTETSSAFGNNLKSIILPSTVTTLGDHAFDACMNLSDITLPEGLESIYASFPNCHSLTTITLPTTLSVVMSYAFINCSTLTAVYCPANYCNFQDQAFDSCPSDLKIYVPTDKVDYYKSNCSIYADKFVGYDF